MSALVGIAISVYHQLILGTGAGGDNILMESADNLLLETGDAILLE